MRTGRLRACGGDRKELGSSRIAAREDSPDLTGEIIVRAVKRNPISFGDTDTARSGSGMDPFKGGGRSRELTLGGGKHDFSSTRLFASVHDFLTQYMTPSHRSRDRVEEVCLLHHGEISSDSRLFSVLKIHDENGCGIRIKLFIRKQCGKA